MAVDSVNYTLTTHCNMSCPDCCAGITAMDKVKRKFHNWEYIENSARYFYGMKNVNITGGEPSVHPKFTEFAPKLKDLFGCDTLSIWTNATMFKRKSDAFKHFDVIHVSNYTKDSWDGSPDNTENIEYLKEYLKDYPIEINVAKVIHTPLTKRGNKPCFRATKTSRTVEFVDDMIYPCCSSSGLPTKICIPISDNWKEEIMKINPPCQECLFAES